MRIVSLATNDVRGGAARSAYRLHQGLVGLGLDATMLVRWKHSSDPSVVALDDAWASSEHVQEERACRQRWVRDNRTERSDTLFTLGQPSMAIAQHPLVRSADLLHLHWVANFLGPSSFAGLAALDIPIVWTLHDEWGYTGGCHYSAGCEQFRNGCRRCPQLREDPLRLIEDLAEERRRAWRPADLTIVGPSAWIVGRAGVSRILGGKPACTIPYGLDTATFRPARADERTRFRAAHGIGPDEFVLVFGVDRLGERRKGYADLVAALGRVERPVTLLRFGNADGADLPRQRTVDLGPIDDDALLALAYGASDAFVLPTLEDNSPNGILESLACATPVVAYATGGVPETVTDGVTGYLAPSGDVAALARALERAFDQRTQRSEMGRRCRERIEREHTLERQASRYLTLYRRIAHAAARESVA